MIKKNVINIYITKNSSTLKFSLIYSPQILYSTLMELKTSYVYVTKTHYNAGRTEDKTNFKINQRRL